MIEAGAAILAQWMNGSACDPAAAVYRAMAEAVPTRNEGPAVPDSTIL